MIFLKKFSAIAMTLAAAAVLGGCSMKKTEKAAEGDVTAATETTAASGTTAVNTEPVTEPQNTQPDDKLTAEEGKYVYDLAHLMTDEQQKECSEYLEELYHRYMLNAAVVTVSDMDEKAPYSYAADAYFKIYGGEGSGVLLLINNDTYEDYLYKSGVCTHFIDAEAEKDAFYTATREIVDGDYVSAVNRIMKLAESCPGSVFDEEEIFTIAESAELEELLSSSKTPAAIVSVNNTDAKKENEKLAQELFSRHFTDGKGIMIMLDTSEKTILAYSPDALPSELTAALKKANESAAKGEYFKAAKAAVSSLSKDTAEESTTQATTAKAR